MFPRCKLVGMFIVLIELYDLNDGCFRARLFALLTRPSVLLSLDSVSETCRLILGRESRAKPGTH